MVACSIFQEGRGWQFFLHKYQYLPWAIVLERSLSLLHGSSARIDAQEWSPHNEPKIEKPSAPPWPPSEDHYRASTVGHIRTSCGLPADGARYIKRVWVRSPLHFLFFLLLRFFFSGRMDTCSVESVVQVFHSQMSRLRRPPLQRSSPIGGSLLAFKHSSAAAEALERGVSAIWRFCRPLD